MAYTRDKLPRPLIVMESFTVGSIAASFAKTIAVPIEYTISDLSYRLSTQTSGGFRAISRSFQFYKYAAKQLGPFFLWKDNLMNLLVYAPRIGLNFAFRDLLQSFIKPYNSHTKPLKYTIRNFVVGGLAGVSSLAIVHPVDHVRVAMINDAWLPADKRKYKSAQDCAQQIFKNEGMQAFYPKFGVCALRVFGYFGCYFGLYDSILELFANKGFNIGVLSKYCIAHLMTAFAATATYPFELVRLRLMIDSQRKTLWYSGTLHCIRQMWKEEGFKSFFRGNKLNVTRNAVCQAIVLVLYDEVKRFMMSNM